MPKFEFSGLYHYINTLLIASNFSLKHSRELVAQGFTKKADASVYRLLKFIKSR